MTLHVEPAPTATATATAAATLFRSDFRQRVEHFAQGDLGSGVQGPRGQSYDHCYNYFLTTPSPSGDMEKSCAVLGFYLASWGMYRGSTYLFKRTNSGHFAPLIEYIEEYGERLRRIDLDSYDAASIDAISESYSRIRKLVLPDRHVAVTLVTKVMVAVFGCVPAYDTYFRTGMRTTFFGYDEESFGGLSGHSLELLGELYAANRDTVDALAKSSRTFRFSDSSATGQPLTRAKIIDMYCFDLGYNPHSLN